MASLSPAVPSYHPSSPSFRPKALSPLSYSLSVIACARTPKAPAKQTRSPSFMVRAQTQDLSASFFEGVGIGEGGEPPVPPGSILSAVEDKEEPQCPPGLRQYETMAVLRPDMSEDERLTLTQKYEEMLIAGGGMYVEVFNRGVIPLAYGIKKKNRAGDSNTYLDGIYLLFTYFTNPDSIRILETTLKTDDNVIRSSTFKVRKRKHC